jgi:hypothetical protein
MADTQDPADDAVGDLAPDPFEVIARIEIAPPGTPAPKLDGLDLYLLRKYGTGGEGPTGHHNVT